jgi:hypothetical protein
MFSRFRNMSATSLLSKIISPVKNQSDVHPNAPATEPTEDDIRNYAYHLYQQNSCAPGHDVDNWLEATACLKANIPTHRTQSRLHQHLNGPQRGKLQTVSS